MLTELETEILEHLEFDRDGLSISANKLIGKIGVQRLIFIDTLRELRNRKLLSLDGDQLRITAMGSLARSRQEATGALQGGRSREEIKPSSFKRDFEDE